jgi:hypothetical protein
MIITTRDIESVTDEAYDLVAIDRDLIGKWQFDLDHKLVTAPSGMTFQLIKRDDELNRLAVQVLHMDAFRPDLDRQLSVNDSNARKVLVALASIATSLFMEAIAGRAPPQQHDTPPSARAH